MGAVATGGAKSGVPDGRHAAATLCGPSGRERNCTAARRAAATVASTTLACVAGESR